MNRLNIQNDMKVALGIAQYVAPIKTGNLRYNAINAENTSDGFRIRYSLSIAHYIYFLEEGTRKSISNQGFISNVTVPLIASFISSKYETENKRLESEFRRLSKLGSIDLIGETEARKKAQTNSLLQLSNGIAEKNNWEHKPFIEQFQPVGFRYSYMPEYFKPF